MLYVDYSPYLEQDERTSQTITLKNINAVLKEEEKKHGKKSIEYQLINELKNNKYNDIAIYTAMALAKTNLLPHWSIEDIKSELDSKTYIDKDLHKYIDKTYKFNGSDAEAKKIAMKVWKSIIENEGSRKLRIRDEAGTDVEIDTNKIIENIKDKNTALAGELIGKDKNDTISKIEIAVLNAFSFIDQLSEIESSYKYGIKDFLNFDPNKSATTTQFINKLIGRGKDYNGNPKSLPHELSLILANFDFDENTDKFVKEIQKKFNAIDKNVLWPESDHTIQSYNELKKYFKSLRSKGETERSEKIIKGYKKKKTQKEVEENFGISEEKFNGIIERAVNKIQSINMSIDPEKFDSALKRVAKWAIESNEGLMDYIIKNEAGEVDDEDKMETAIGELSSIIIKKRKERDAHLGRKKDIWK